MAFAEHPSLIGPPNIPYVRICATVIVFLDAGIYYGVDWSAGLLVGSNASLRTVIATTQTYLAGLGGGSVFLSLIGTHVFAPTLIVTLIGISFFGLGKSTVLQVDGAAPARLFQVDADDVTFQNLAFDGNKAAYVDPGETDGINVINDSARTLIIGCYFHDFSTLNSHSIEVQFGSAATDVVVANCHFMNNDSYSLAFVPAAGHCIAHGCTVVNSGGFEAGQGSFNIFANNTFKVVAATMQLIMIFSGNIAIGNTFESVAAALRVTADDCSVIGNVFSLTSYQAIDITGGDDVLVVGNRIIGAVNVRGIYLGANTERATILSNRIGDCTYGVYILNATVVDTMIFNNNFAGTTTPVWFAAGAPTVIVPTLVLPFVQGTTFLSADGAAWGWEIDADTEYAIALGHLPPAVQQVIYVKVMAVALVLEADAMRLEINGYGGASNEAFTQETIAVANKPSATTNFAANDYVYWWLSKTDDADIGHLLGGDSIMFKVKHEAAGDGDCATDAVFLCVVIEYV